MAITKPVPSPAVRQAFRQGLEEMIQMGRAPRDLAKAVDPQQIYVLAVSDIAEGAGVAAARPAVWEFLVGSAAGPAVAVCIAHPPKGKSPRMTSLTRGAIPAEAIEATRQVERLPQVQTRDYELRRLRISGLSIGAFWLKPQAGARDLAVPYHAIHHELQRMRPYPMGEFMTVIRRLARQRVQFDDAPRVSRKTR
ncbi:MAG TPA: hypothetical protein VMU80_10535 [Bryobacteraceae bacterium]|nr:hypothetical protein [Bryobacteraceae bacterium]HUO29646.1 hypothetical protein [Bryobacteraceae bacterium]